MCSSLSSPPHLSPFPPPPAFSRGGNESSEWKETARKEQNFGPRGNNHQNKASKRTNEWMNARTNQKKPIRRNGRIWHTLGRVAELFVFKVALTSPGWRLLLSKPALAGAWAPLGINQIRGGGEGERGRWWMLPSPPPPHTPFLVLNCFPGQMHVYYMQGDRLILKAGGAIAKLALKRRQLSPGKADPFHYGEGERWGEMLKACHSQPPTSPASGGVGGRGGGLEGKLQGGGGEGMAGASLECAGPLNGCLRGVSACARPKKYIKL